MTRELSTLSDDSRPGGVRLGSSTRGGDPLSGTRCRRECGHHSKDFVTAGAQSVQTAKAAKSAATTLLTTAPAASTTAGGDLKGAFDSAPSCAQPTESPTCLGHQIAGTIAALPRGWPSA